MKHIEMSWRNATAEINLNYYKPNTVDGLNLEDEVSVVIMGSHFIKARNFLEVLLKLPIKYLSK